MPPHGSTVFPEQLDQLPPGATLDLLRAELALEAGEASRARDSLTPADDPLLGFRAFEARSL
jgi:hypothetical protein